MPTLYELPPHHFARVEPIFASLWFDEPYVEAALSGRQSGRVFVDDPGAPSAALLCRTYEYYLAGEPVEPLRRFLLEAPAEPDVFQHLYGLCPLDPAWINLLLAQGPFEAIPRHNFRWVGAPLMDWRAALPDGARIVPIDRALAARIDAEWHETIGLLWEGYDRYVAGGFGRCLLLGEVLGSMANSDGVGAGLANIGVRTAPDQRRRGLARLVCTAFIEATLARGLEPSWDTDGMNTPSRALAAKLGFVEGRPFTELAMPERQPMPLSHGRWHAEPGADGITIWVGA